MTRHKSLVISQSLFLALLSLLAAEHGCDLSSRRVLLFAVLGANGIYLVRYFKNASARVPLSGISVIINSLLLAWELASVTYKTANPILLPPPAEVFQVFESYAPLMLRGVVSSLALLGFAMAAALSLGVLTGLFIGRTPVLCGIFLPIAKVLSPIPPIIYSPYAVAVMPTFKSAAALIITLGIFWPVSMNIINRVSGMDKRIINSAKALGITHMGMVYKILLPYLLPGIIKSLHVTLSTSFLLLTMAEMMGASSGLGYFIKNYADYANYTNVIAGIILIGIVITALNMAVTEAEKKFIKWTE